MTEQSIHRATSASRFRKTSAANVNSAGLFATNKSTAADPQTTAKRDLHSKTTFESAANRTLNEGRVQQQSEPDIQNRTVASLKNTCIVGVRSSGFFEGNTIPVNAHTAERHVKSTLMGQTRDSAMTPMVKSKL